MPANIEIKTVMRNRAAALATAVRLSGAEPEIIQQEDTFFRCDGARLKLRIFPPDQGAPERGELIRYERADIFDARCSRYSIARTADPRALLEILTKILDEMGAVKKTRALYLVGQTRIQIDQVEGLGDFLELEVVLRNDQSEDDGKRIANQLASSESMREI